MGGVESGSNSSPWISYSAVRTISPTREYEISDAARAYMGRA